MRPRFGAGDVDPTRAPSTSGAAPLGTIRNRTEVFMKYRRHALAGRRPLFPGPANSSSTLDASETARLVSSAMGGPSDLEVGPEPPGYVRFRDAARAEMRAIRDEMAKLKALHGRATLNRFDDSNDEEIQVEISTQHITKLFRKCEAQLKQFGSLPSSTDADEKVKRALQRTLAAELQGLSLQFRKDQKAYLATLRRRGAGGSGGGGTFASLNGGRDEADFDLGFSDVQMQKADTLTTLIDDRAKEVAGIVSSIGELAQVMRDLSVLVIDQGTVLDRIDHNMEAAAARVEQGVQQLQKAERKQKQGLAATCILALLVAIAILVVFVAIKIIVF